MLANIKMAKSLEVGGFDNESLQTQFASSGHDGELKNETTSNAEEESDDSEIPSSGDLSGVERNQLFIRAESLFSKRQLDQALSAYLRCIKGLERGCGFLYLPQCLHQIAEVYHQKEEDKKAIQFLKAEKIYYETALIDSKQVQEKLEKMAEGDSQSEESSKGEDGDRTRLRASEYESLAKLCLEKSQHELALEFCGKATLLYQQHYGDDNPTTQRALDLLTSVYAEVGRREYEDKINEYKSSRAESENEYKSSRAESENEYKSSRVESGNPEIKTGDGMRKRRGKAADKQQDEKTTTKESTVTSEQADSSADPCQSNFAGRTNTSRDGWTRRDSFLLFCVIVLSILAVYLFTFSYCRVTRTSWTCHHVRTQYRRIAQMLEFTYYKWTTPSTPSTQD